MGRPTIKIPGEKGEREGERVQVTLPCKAWEHVSGQDDVIGTIEGHSPVHFTSPCEDEGRGGPTR